MKIVCISDIHLDCTTLGVSRFEEAKRALDEAVAYAIKEKADLFVFCGDAMDPDSGSIVFRCIDVLVRAASCLGAQKILSIWLSGNHDILEDGTDATTLLPVANAAYAMVISSPVYAPLSPRLELLAFPFTSTSRAYDPVEHAKKAADGKGPLLVLSHLHVQGVIAGEESKEMSRGREVWLPDEELAQLAKRRPMLVLQGHYHRRQRHRTMAGLDFQIIGATTRNTFGECAHSPGFLVIDWAI